MTIVSSGCAVTLFSVGTGCTSGNDENPDISEASVSVLVSVSVSVKASMVSVKEVFPSDVMEDFPFKVSETGSVRTSGVSVSTVTCSVITRICPRLSEDLLSR